MSITSTAIRKNRVTGVLIGVLLVSGVGAYQTMPQQMDPGFIIRVAQVVTRFPGASPDRVEQLVTDPIDQAVQSLPDLDCISSTSRPRVSRVPVPSSDESQVVQPLWASLLPKLSPVALPGGPPRPRLTSELR